MSARNVITKRLVILAGYEPSNDDTIASWHLFERDTDAIIAALRAAGYEIVPREATDGMLNAMEHADATHGANLWAEAWNAAMLAASSPRPPIGENK